MDTRPRAVPPAVHAVLGLSCSMWKAGVQIGVMALEAPWLLLVGVQAARAKVPGRTGPLGPRWGGLGAARAGAPQGRPRAEIHEPWPPPLPPSSQGPLLVSNFLTWQLGELMESSGRILVANQGLWGGRAPSLSDARRRGPT